MSENKPNQVASTILYDQEVSQGEIRTTNLEQILFVFSPVSNEKINAPLKNPIEYNKKILFTTSKELFEYAGVCPAYMLVYVAELNGYEGKFYVTFIEEKTPFNKELHLVPNGTNTKNVSYFVSTNGRTNNNGRESEFTITPNDTNTDVINKIVSSINGNIYSPINASSSIKPAIGSTITTIDLTNNLQNLLGVDDGGIQFNIDNTNYDFTLNTKGTVGNTTTIPLGDDSDNTSNISKIIATTQGSFNIRENQGIIQEILYSNTNTKSCIVTQNLRNTFQNFENKVGIFDITNNSLSNPIELDTNELPATQTTDIITGSKLTSLKALDDATFSITTSENAQTIDITIDLQTITDLDSLVTILNAGLSTNNVSAEVIKQDNDALIFQTIKKGSTNTINISATNPNSGTDITSSTYLDIASGHNINGIDKLDITSLVTTSHGLYNRIKNILDNKKVTEVTININTNGDLIFQTQSTETITVDYVSGVDFTNIDYFDITNSFSYNGLTTITTTAELTSYLNSELKRYGMGNVVYDITNKTLIFNSDDVGVSSQLVITAGTTGVDLTGTDYLDISSSSTKSGTNKLISMNEFVTSFENELQTNNIPLEIYLEKNKLIFTNINTTGTISTLVLNVLPNHAGEQFIDSDLFDITNATSENGKDETDSVLIVSKWSGDTANDLNIEILTNQTNDDNFTFSFSNNQDGSGNREFTDAFEDIGDIWLTIFGNVYGKILFDQLENFNGNPDDKTGRYKLEDFKPFSAITGSNEENTNELLKYSESRALDLTNSIVTAPKVKQFPFEVAGAWIGRMKMWETSPHKGLLNLTLEGLIVNNDIGEMSKLPNRNILVENGISTVKYIESIGKLQIQDFVNFRRPPTQNKTSFDYSRPRNLNGIDWNIAFNVKKLEEQYVLGKTIVGDDDIITVDETINPSRFKSLLIDLFTRLSQQAIITNPKYTISTLTVVISSNNSQRFNAQWLYYRTATVNIVSNKAIAQFNIGA